MSKKSSHRKSKLFSKKDVIFMVKIGIVFITLVLTILLGIYIPKSMNKSDATIEMTKDYEPGEDVMISLKQNEEISHLVDHDIPKEIITINSDLASKEMITEDPIIEEQITEEQITEEPKESTRNDETIEIIAKNIKTELITGNTLTENKNTNNNSEEQILQEETIESSSSSGNDNDSISDTALTDNQNSIDDSLGEPTETLEEDNKQYVKDEWVDDIIHENKDSIDKAELEAGAAIYNKLDTAYLFGLADGGMTEEEKLEAKKYLKTNLSVEEYNLALRLFNKYIGVVE